MNNSSVTTVSLSIGAGLLGALLGGWDMALEILLIIIVLDYITGVASAFKHKTISSSYGYIGIMKKASIFVVVILAAQMDRMTGSTNHLFRNSTAFFFAANDALSILENVGNLGVRMPAFLRNALVELQETYNELSTKDEKESKESVKHEDNRKK